MALDGLFLSSIAQELQNTIIGCRVDKIAQPEKDEITLSFKINRKNKKLLISASSNYPRIHFTEIVKKNPMQPPMYCMVLRKYILGARVVSLKQLNNDRILIINFQSTDELGFDSIYSLIIEVMGRHSNITLVRDRDNVVMDSIKHITADMNTFRSLYAGINYVFPPESDKLNPFKSDYDEYLNFITNNNLQLNEKIFSRIFTGLSKETSLEIFTRIENELNIEENNLKLDNKIVFDKAKDFLSNIEKENFVFKTYFKKDKPVGFHCVELESLKDCDYSQFNSASELLESYYKEKDKFERLNSKSSDLQRLINNNLDRCNKKLKILNKNLEDCKNRDKYQLYGELLTSYIYSIEPNSKEALVLNYYNTEEEEYIKIPLDEYKTPSQNIQKYYKKYNKLKKSEEMGKIQIDAAKEEIDYLSSVLTNIFNLENNDEIDEIRGELIESGYLRRKKGAKNKKSKKSKPMHFVSSEGADIYVGKNNLQNDYLTLKFASRNDIWMHTKNIPGSHVIVKTDVPITDVTLGEAANLAAYYSKGKDSTKVPVDYTEVKNIKKPSGAKPGMVIYYTNKTYYIDPLIPTLNKA